MNYMKNICRTAIFAIIMIVSFTTNSYAFDTYYKKEFNEKILNGVDYQRNIYLTNQGWLNTYVIKVDYSKDYLDIVPVYSKDIYGKRDILTNLLKGSNFIAGVNADFFDMRNSMSYPIGTLVEDGKLLATSNINDGSDNYASIFFNRNNPFIDFFDVNMRISMNGQTLYNIKHLNKFTNFDVPVVINNADLFPTTNEMDYTYKNLLYKVVVVNDSIVYISNKGETITVPKNGYVIVMKEKDFLLNKNLLIIGQPLQFDINSSININKIDYAISGSVKILEDGQVVNRGVPNTGKNPRTAIGISEDGKQIILVAIDGRSVNSVGVTHEELADLMLSYGAYNALNFDGGGSTTMALKDEEGKLKIINELSDGSQRKIENGLGIVNNSTISDATDIKINLSNNKFSPKTEIKLSVVGHDEYGNISSPNAKDIKWSYKGVKGKLVGDKFIADSNGKLTLTAQYKNAKDTITVDIADVLDNIKFNIESIVVDNNATQKLEVFGFDELGNKITLDTKKLQFKVSSSALGKIVSGQFKAGTKYTKGYITATYTDKAVSIPVIVGGKPEVFNNFDKGNLKISLKTNVETKDNAVKYTTTKVKSKGKALELDYRFDRTNEGQGAGIAFDEPIVINEKIRGIGFDIYGDNSGNVVGINIKDADEKEYNLYITNKINWSGYQFKSINIDGSINFPITIEKIYTYAPRYSKAPKLSSLYFDNLYIQKIESTSDIKLPLNNINDNLKTIVNSTGDKSFNLLILDNFDWYDIKKQADYIKNINSTYKLVLTTDFSKKIEKDIKTKKVQNKNVNVQLGYPDVQVIYLYSDDKYMYNFMETNLVNNKMKNFIIMTDQIIYDDSIKKSNKQIILESLVNEAASQNKNILVVNKNQHVEGHNGNVKYLPIDYSNPDNQAIKVKIVNGNMKYGYLK